MASTIYIYTGKAEGGDDSKIDVPTDIRKAIVESRVDTITSKSFKNCRLLMSVSLPLGLKVIGESAFEKCTSLKTIGIPSSVNVIHYGAFRQCTGLQTMDLPEGLTEIAAETFQHCESLRHVHISSTVLEIGRNAFWGCRQLPHVDLPHGLRRIGPGVFTTCRSLTRILIPATVVAIGSMAFSGCVVMRSVEISLGEDCSTNVGLQSIESYAFNICSNLINIAIPKNCNVASKAFRGCQHSVFDLDDNDLRERLKSRFDNLPHHKVCYQQGHADEKPIEFASFSEDDERGSDRTKDMFGLTPFHILALSSRPSVVTLQKLMEEATSVSTDGILRLDKSRATPLRYAIENYAPEALAFIRAILHAMIEKRTNGLSSKLWKSVILQEIESFGGRDTAERTQNVHKLFALLRLYERKESISLLEQALWKCRMEADGDQESQERAAKRAKLSDDDDSRQGSYLHSGAGTVILNVSPYLGSIVRTLNF
ncbi:unnamed protein product [Cylindrotheca closterium]|uniref:Uncharacterized protein n=1 Tax=Cylindrotheca closterium TaxID=2856 RepID=A0AAD2JJX1_9STRA|nr:unnamed protein product [Cylindrotheca closterium]